MNNKIKISYFLHTSLGEEDGKYYIKDILNNYFTETSYVANIKIIASYQSKQFFHNSQLSIHIDKALLDSNANFYGLKKFNTIRNGVISADVCFLFMPCMSSVIAAILCMFYRKPFVTYFGANWHDLIITNNPKRIFGANIKRFLSNLLSRHSIFSLHTGKGILESHKGINKFLTAPILNLSTDTFYRRTIYNNLSTEPEINILFVGALTENKGVFFLLQAFNMLNSSKVVLHIVGDGIEKENLKKITEQLGLVNNVIFHGFIANGPHLFELYQKCDIFVLPSFSEGLPRVLYEAAGNGCPIITTPVNSIPYIFNENFDCLFIKPGDKIDIASKINRMITEPGLNEKLAKNAFNTVEPILKERAYEQHYHLIEKYIK